MQTQEPQAGFPCSYGKYQLLARIGQGGMAEIFRARLPGVAGFEKILVIKRLLPHLRHQLSMVRMFVNEAKLAAEVQHRNVVQVFELGQLDDGEYYMAMEHIAGTDLRQILRAAAMASIRIPPWFAVHVLCEVLDGLTCAHNLRDEHGRLRRVVHRDVTPANIFISYLGDIKLGDFGVAKDETREDKTRVGLLKGKVPYMAPEQLHGKDLDARTDVFAAATVLWECLTQRRLFGGRPDIEAMNLICFGERVPPSTFVRDVPPELDAIVLRALAGEREQRTPSAEAFQSQLLEILPSLRPRVHSTDIRNIVEVVMGNRDPSNPANSNSHPPELSSEDINFLESTPGPANQLARPLLPKQESGVARADTPYTPPRIPPPIEALPSRLPPVDALPPRLPPVEVLPALPPIEVPLARAPTRVEHPWPRMPPPIARHTVRASGEGGTEDLLRVWSTPAVPASHRIERMPMPRRDDPVLGAPQAAIAPAEPIITDAYPRALLTGYEGPHPFWVRTKDGATFGPISHLDAIAALRIEAQNRAIEHASISSTRQRWMDATTFCVLTGQEMLVDPHATREKELPKSAISGRLDRISMVSLFARLARERVTGRLVVANGLARREMVLVDGRPSFIYANAGELQIPELLVEKKIVSQEQIAEILHWVVLESRPIEEVVAHRAGYDIARYYASFMKERLLELFRWRSGAYAVEQTTMISHSTPFVGSLLQLLLEMVMRTRTPEELRSLLSAHAETRFERSERFSRCVADMRLNDAQLLAVAPFGGRTLAGSLRSSRDEKLALALAYTLIEADLLYRVI